MKAAVALLLLLLSLGMANARIHNLQLVAETRRYFIVSSFGLVMNGNVTLQTSGLLANEYVTQVGFTIHRSSAESTDYILDQRNAAECIFDSLPDNNTYRLPLALDSGGFQTPKDQLDGLSLATSTFLENKRVWNQVFAEVTKPESENIYTIAFHICGSIGAAVNLDMRLTEVNPGDYLGAGLSMLPTMLFCMAGVYFVATCVWIRTLYLNRNSIHLHKIHFLMLMLVVTKMLSLLFHAIDYHFIKVKGAQEEGWAITYYIMHICKGFLLFITILLIGAGFGFIKHVLSHCEKQLIAVVLSLQVIANVAMIVVDETSEGTAKRTTWRTIGLLVDLVCCGAILFPVVWSMRHLREATSIDGKAAISLQKLKLFRRFYVMVLAYIYSTRIIVYLIESTIPFRFEWVATLLDEIITLLFYSVTAYMFSPLPDNQYLQLPTDDEGESIQMDEIVTTSGVADGLRNTRTGATAENPNQSRSDASEDGIRKKKKVAIEE
jgi:hypothetical protein